jgi:raffinose/stachyose/melibiose transport system permease protein
MALHSQMQLAPAAKPRRRTADIVVTLLRYVIALSVALIVLVPLLTSIFGALKTTGELLLSPFSLPTQWQWGNFTGILQSSTFWQELSNSVFVTLVTASAVAVLAAMPAFVFARMEFKGKDLLYNFFTLGLLFPVAVAILPLFITIRQVGLLDTHFGVILPQVAFGLPGNILILRGFFAAVPKELEDAAAIDGCGTVGFFWRILLPLVRPAMAAVVVLTMVASWNAFFLPLLVLNKESMWTLPLGIMQFQGQFGTDWSRVLAFVTLALVPTIGFYLLAERQIISGLTAGAVKG